ncbi:hypothetical protein D3C84_791580 [compost metagenome]
MREPQKRNPSAWIRQVMSSALSRPASVSGSCRLQNTCLVSPSTPVTATLERVLCQPISLSMSARMAMALAVAQMVPDALAVVSHLVKSPKMGITSR